MNAAIFCSSLTMTDALSGKPEHMLTRSRNRDIPLFAHQGRSPALYHCRSKDCSTCLFHCLQLRAPPPVPCTSFRRQTRLTTNNIFQNLFQCCWHAVAEYGAPAKNTRWYVALARRHCKTWRPDKSARRGLHEPPSWVRWLVITNNKLST